MGQDLAPSEYRMLRPVQELHRKLLDWFAVAQRDMPWRRTTDPYAIWISETMLQQTQIETVKPYFARFLGRFPTVLALSEADLQEVLRFWAGLGYYRRARHLHAAAKQVVSDFGGKLPGKVEDLVRLPGVGRYTAGAVASIAFGSAVPVVDGNVMRVLARLTGFDRDIAEPRNAGFFWELGGKLHGALEGESRSKNQGARRDAKNQSRHVHGNLNEALMELGATVCTPATPACGECPVKGFCRAFAEGRQGELPVKGKKGATPMVRGVAVAVVRDAAKGRRGNTAKEVLLMRRPAGGLWGEMWEFPVFSGHSSGQWSVVSGQKKTDLVVRWLQGEVGVQVADVELCGTVRHQLTHRLFEYEVVRCVECGRAEGVRLPACVAGGGRYAGSRWVAWPLEKSVEVPVARVVHRIAEVGRGGS